MLVKYFQMQRNFLYYLNLKIVGKKILLIIYNLNIIQIFNCLIYSYVMYDIF